MALIIGNAKKNKLIGTNSADTIKGLDGNDTLLGNGGIDKMFGGAGNDTMNGGAGNDIMKGGSGNDKMDGGAGDDTVKGEAGNDTFTHSLGGDAYSGGSGTDTVNYSGALSGISVDLPSGTGTGAAVGDTFNSIEKIIGTQFVDILQGGSGAETLMGGTENDNVKGGGGADTLFGGADDDNLLGESGVDTMTGNSGQDGFFYSDYAALSAIESGVGVGLRDIITDFTQGDDFIGLSSIDADLLSGGDQAFTFIGTTGFGLGAAVGEVRYDIDGGNTIIQIDHLADGDFTADFEIQLTGVFTLTAADFQL